MKAILCMLALIGAMVTLASAVSAGPVARFSEVTYQAIDAPEPAPGHYRNPVLPGFHPDPSIVKVGGDFYLVTSTFGWFPGLPVFHSRDLVNWELIGHAIDRPGMVDLAGLGIVTDGLYAPAITFHEGSFYIFNTCVRCGGNFYVSASDPAGPWSDPVWVDFDGIDPSLFFDEDGTAWVINNDLPEGGETYRGHRALWVQRIDLATGTMTGPRTMVVNGGVHIGDKPIWAEGPHIFKHGGWYYINAAEGGTAEDHSQTIYRSRNITGPYEPGPFNPTLTQRDLAPDRPDRVEATGHADLVQLDDGSWWGVFLATRPFEGQLTLLGRETWLLPLRWVDGWPRFLDHGQAVPMELPRPDLPQSEGTDWGTWSDEFKEETLSDKWLTMRGPAVDWLSLENGDLRIVAGKDRPSGKGQPHAVMRRMRHPEAVWLTTLSFDPEAEGDFAGLLAFAHEDHYLALVLGKDANGPAIMVRKRSSAESGEETLASWPLEEVPESVNLWLEIRNGIATAKWSPVGASRIGVFGTEFDVSDMASVNSGLFTGVTVGPYAVQGPR